MNNFQLHDMLSLSSLFSMFYMRVFVNIVAMINVWFFIFSTHQDPWQYGPSTAPLHLLSSLSSSSSTTSSTKCMTHLSMLKKRENLRHLQTRLRLGKVFKSSVSSFHLTEVMHWHQRCGYGFLFGWQKTGEMVWWCGYDGEISTVGECCRFCSIAVVDGLHMPSS